MTEVAQHVFGLHYELVKRYVDLLATQGVDWGLIGPREVDRLWERHILNAAALDDVVPQGATVIDVGSGAGLPGIPLAVLRSDLRITLLEPLLRRSTFLTQAVDDLGITGTVTVVRARAEDHRLTYDVVTARAVAPLDRLITWCAPLMRADGALLALKGQSAQDEVATAGPLLNARRLSAEVLTVRSHPEADPTFVVRVRRASSRPR